MRVLDPVHALFRWRLLFPKKEGAALQDALPHVLAVYAPNKASEQGERGARLIGKVLHVSYHSIPKDGSRGPRLLALAAVAILWLLAYPLAMKLRCLISAVLYSFTECAFTHFERGRPYTSVAQLVGNLLYTPVLLDAYGWAFEGTPFLYVALFPLNVWVLEIVQGYCISWVYGRNVAWCYLDYADELLSGCIRVGHGVFWWGLGLACLLLHPILCRATALAVSWITG
mmetsp:Transcript_37820/g.108047  ORF Transcript_37820/g.108047 Transcript_37820/m.108047 type:complete len:228 (-) Transcript_37820:92-775(-)